MNYGKHNNKWKELNYSLDYNNYKYLKEYHY